MASLQLEVDDVYTLIGKWENNEPIGSPRSAMFEGKEYSLQQLQFFLTGHRRVQLTKIIQQISKNNLTMKPTVCYAWRGNKIVRGVQERGVPEYIRGTPYLETSGDEGILPCEHVFDLRGTRERSYNYAIQGGKYWYVESSITGTPDYEGWDEDVKVRFFLSKKSSEMVRIERFDVYFPAPEHTGSFLEMDTYKGAEYSVWSETHHGPIADQVLSQWTGEICVPADGGGLFASRGREGVFGDAVIGDWTDPRVEQEAIGQTLSRCLSGQLQVFFYCTAFMTDDDFTKVRHPFLFVDKYPPFDRYRTVLGGPKYYMGDGWVSSVPFTLQDIEGAQYSNPSFTENLIRLGLVKFESTGLHSIYASHLGIESPTGVGVSQTWKDFHKDRSRFFCMTGMVPIIRSWKFPEKKYSRVIYWTTDIAPSGSSSSTDGKVTYFYFPTPHIQKYGDVYEVLPFPSVDIVDAIDRTKEDYPHILKWQWPHIEFVLASRGVPYIGIFVDLRRFKSLYPYFPSLTKGCALPKSLVDREILEKSDDGTYWISDNIVCELSFRRYPGAVSMSRPMSIYSDPIQFLSKHYPDSVVWREDNAYYVGDLVPEKSKAYGERAGQSDLRHYSVDHEGRILAAKRGFH